MTVTARDTTPGVSGSVTFTWTVNTVVHSGPVKNAATSKCLDDYHALTANGNKVDLYKCNGTNAQKWAGP